MESQVIDYYNEMPYGINVIDKMNDELKELQMKVDKMSGILNKFKSPIMVVTSFKEYSEVYMKIEEFEKRIVKIMSNRDNGLFKIINKSSNGNYYNRYRRGLWLQSLQSDESFVDQLIFELNELTQKQNKEWCELRINLALETCLIKSDSRYLGAFGTIETIKDAVINPDDNDYLPSVYVDLCHSDIEEGLFYDESCLYNLIRYRCNEPLKTYPSNTDISNISIDV